MDLPKATFSGEGKKSIVPPEIQNMGFNWGAALLGTIWCVGNGMSYFDGWISFGPELGRNGNVLAWRHKRWGSIEEFKNVQRRWAMVAFLSLALLMALLIGFAVIFSELAVSSVDNTLVMTFLKPILLILAIGIGINIFFLRRKKK